MENSKIYQDIAKRTDGDIYVGVVGPVRTGKSTFIKKFMELLVLPNIDNSYKRERATDELPQSAGGRTIMTTEPKFVPNEAIEIKLEGNLKLKTRLVDCVGYLVDNAIGYLEEDSPRMVKTPWSEKEMPFEIAAELGTKKVIVEHSTVGIVVTTDGSITDIERESYENPEERVVNELQELNKPFIILLNSINPNSEETINLAKRLEEKYSSSVIPVSVEELNIEDMNMIFAKLLYEFNIERINIRLPKWFDSLSFDDELKNNIFDNVRNVFNESKNIKDVLSSYKTLEDNENIKNVSLTEIDLGTGFATIEIGLEDELFYKTLSTISGIEIKNEAELFSTIMNFSRINKEYEKIEMALNDVNNKGYGIVNPEIDDLILDEPEIIKQGSRYGVKLKATAPSIHMMRIETETEVSPLVGTEKQSEDLIKYLLAEFESDPKKIWQSNIFGKSLHELVNEGLQNKLAKMPEEAQNKLRDTLQRVVNEGSSGLICIIL